MFVSIDKIIELIEICKDVKERTSEDCHRIHVDDIAATLQKLIDDEMAELDKMALEHEAREGAENDRLSYNNDEVLAAACDEMAREMEDREWGRLRMEEAAIEKELEVDFNWPHGV